MDLSILNFSLSLRYLYVMRELTSIGYQSQALQYTRTASTWCHTVEHNKKDSEPIKIIGILHTSWDTT